MPRLHCGLSARSGVFPLPDLRVEEAAEEAVPGDAVEAGRREGGRWIREMGDAQAGEKPEDEIEKTDI